jgi:hypothetical protein
MPKIATPSQRKTLRNHPSWEDDPAAQAALCPIIAKWLAQGVLEYFQWDDRVPVLLQPCGAVPKGSAPSYRLITDARYGNSMYSDWGVTYRSAADLSGRVGPAAPRLHVERGLARRIPPLRLCRREITLFCGNFQNV